MKRRRESARLTPKEGEEIATAIEEMLRQSCDIVDENGDAFADHIVAKALLEMDGAESLARVLVRAARRAPGVFVA